MSREGGEFRVVAARARHGYRTRLPGRAQARPPVVREIQAARRPAGAEEDRPGLDGRGRPAAGFFTKRTAQAWLDEVLASARRGSLPGMVRTGATVADAAAEWLRWAEHERDSKPSTFADWVRRRACCGTA